MPRNLPRPYADKQKGNIVYSNAHLSNRVLPIHQAVAVDRGESLSERVLQGLKSGEFEVAFQPIIHARTRVLWSVECLLRWNHPQYGLLLPGAFAESLHDPDVAREASYFVLGTACRQLEEIQRAGSVLPRVAINIRPSQLLDDGFVIRVADVTALHGIHPSLIELELLETEDASILLATREFTDPLKQLGVHISLDDFGSGYSSLATLGSMNVDTVKLAQDFISRVPTRPRACEVATAILDLLAKLDMTVVVEGVESEAQRNWLEQKGEIYIQGYQIARPAPTLSDAITRYAEPRADDESGPGQCV
jgi:EAL domain-containing protein (putative c-di-GMP-specific phosphodiesterase class I)